MLIVYSNSHVIFSYRLLPENRKKQRNHTLSENLNEKKREISYWLDSNNIRFIWSFKVNGIPSVYSNLVYICVVYSSLYKPILHGNNNIGQVYRSWKKLLWCSVGILEFLTWSRKFYFLFVTMLALLKSTAMDWNQTRAEIEIPSTQAKDKKPYHGFGDSGAVQVKFPLQLSRVGAGVTSASTAG